jgi:hypothetical protein
MPTKSAKPQQTLMFAETKPEPRKKDLRGCDVVNVGKRRDGGTRYWCLKHHADATAKYGKPSVECRYARVPPVTEEETLDLQLADFEGGVALWGAVPPVYDTTQRALDRGIHVHARKAVDGPKLIDNTFRAVRLQHEKRLGKEGVLLSELDAIYFMVSSVFGFAMKSVSCTLCGYSHLDKDWFSVHAHRGHLCSGCGRHFKDTEQGIGNPIRAVQDALQLDAQPPKRAKKHLRIKQRDYPGGLQIWGSNASMIWTSKRHEEEGIHVHGYKVESPSSDPEIDDTFSEVTIDDLGLDAVSVRTLMGQQALPHLAGRVVTLDCGSCGRAHFSTGPAAFTAATSHQCEHCGKAFEARGRLRKVISNPMIRLRDDLARFAPRVPQQHDLGLLPETI